MNDLLISLTTLPTLALLTTLRATTRLVIEAGQWSEELFRGDRLPFLEFPEKTTVSPTESKPDQ